MSKSLINTYDLDAITREDRTLNYSILLIVNLDLPCLKLKHFIKNVDYVICSINCLNLVNENLG